MITDIIAFLGEFPDSFEYNNNFHRFGKKKYLWAVGDRLSHAGKEFSFITCGNWKTGEKETFRSWDKDLEKDNKEFRKKIKKSQEKINSSVKLETQLKNKEAKEEALLEIAEFSPFVGNQYTTKKQVETFKGLLKDKFDNLIVPTYDHQLKVTGYQKITDKGKYFKKGQQIKGCFFPVGNIEKSDYIYIAEGYATAATIYETTNIPCAVSFNCHNITNAVHSIIQKYGPKKFIIAADNDKSKAGIKGANKAKREHSNVQVVIPDFGGSVSSLSDFNDLYIAEGKEETLKQLAFNRSEFNTVSFLGHKEGKYFFYSSRSKTIMGFSPSEMRAGDLTTVALDKYWAARYFMNPDTGRCIWNLTTERIIDEQQSNFGFFTDEKIRGKGAWIDGTDKILNTGDKLFKNGNQVDFGYLNYFYIPSGGETLPVAGPLPTTDFNKIYEALALVAFKTERDRIGFLGFIAQAPVFSCLDWKSHIWLVAPAGSGKSTLLTFLDELLINAKLFQDSTAAGVRQLIKNNATVSLIDEAEGDVYKTKKLLEMARHSSSGQKATVARGTVTGKAISQNVTTCFSFGSIQQPSMSDADESRILTVNLKKPDRDQEKEKLRKKTFLEALEMSNDLFSYVFENLDKYKQLIKEARECLIKYGATSRQADQNANLIGGAALLTGNFVEVLVINYLKDENLLEIKTDFNEDLLVRVENLGIRFNNSDYILGNCLEDYSKHDADVLSFYGIKRVKDKVYFRKEPKLIAAFKKEGIADFWRSATNSPQFVTSTAKFSGRTSRVLALDLSKRG